uniref:Calmodulin-sensitive adenylate cyclase n=1 Tax=Arsenophonus endosymbiont of Trialeurodes vaporariorum TaxID=235567 RepID=A0A3B0MEZ1_9GAMM
MHRISNNLILNAAYPRQMTEQPAPSTSCQKNQPKSGIPATHLKTLSNYAIQKNLIYGIRPISPFATSLIEAVYPTKPLMIKGKTADWGPQAGFICVDQYFSKLVGQSGQVQKYNALISKNIQNSEAIGVPLTINRHRIIELIELGCLESSRSRGDRMISLARSPTGQEYQFEAIPQSNNHNHYQIEIDGKLIYVLIEPEIQEFFVPDYDLLLVATHFRNFGALYNIISYKRNDPIQGTINCRTEWLAYDIHCALGRDKQHKLIHHGADVYNESSELADNFPVTLFLPKVIGKYAKIMVLHSVEVLAEFIQAANNEDYHVPLNVCWQEMHNIRRASYEEARQRVEHYYRKLSL